MAKSVMRTALYSLVWSVPMRELARRFGVSDVALAKKCRAAGIPVPERGFWAKKRAGRRMVQPPLPPRFPGASGLVHFGDRFACRSDGETEDEFLARTPQPPQFEEPIDAFLERIQKWVGRVPLAHGQAPYHRQIARLLEAETQRAREAAEKGWSWNEPAFASRFERRRLKVLNAIFCALERAGAKPEVRGREARDLNLRVGDQNFKWKLDEPRAVGRERGYAQVIEERSGEPIPPLKLQLGSCSLPARFQTTWQDSTEVKIEAHLTDIVVTMILAGEVRYRGGAREHFEWEVKRQSQIREERRRRQEEAERKERERQARLARERTDGLLRDAAAFRQAGDIRAYVMAVLERLSAAGNEVASPSAVEQWARWARQQADAVDPLASGRFFAGMKGV